MNSTPSSSPKAHAVKFRAECQVDVDSYLALLGTRARVLSSEVKPPFPDVEVVLESDYSLEELRDLSGGVEDGHVIARTMTSVVPLDRDVRLAVAALKECYKGAVKLQVGYLVLLQIATALDSSVRALEELQRGNASVRSDSVQED